MLAGFFQVIDLERLEHKLRSVLRDVRLQRAHDLGEDFAPVEPGMVPPAVSAPISLYMPSAPDEVAGDITVRKMDIRHFRELGFIHEVNRLLLHPCGLALEVSIDPATGVESLSGVWDCSEDPDGIIFGDDYLDHAKAETVATLLETRGAPRAFAEGWVVQPVDPGVRQLHLTIKEPVARVGQNGDFDEGEERPA